MVEPARERRVKFEASRECFAIGALDDEKHHCAVTLRDHRFKLSKVF